MIWKTPAETPRSWLKLITTEKHRDFYKMCSSTENDNNNNKDNLKATLVFYYFLLAKHWCPVQHFLLPWIQRERNALA